MRVEPSTPEIELHHRVNNTNNFIRPLGILLKIPYANLITHDYSLKAFTYFNSVFLKKNSKV